MLNRNDNRRWIRSLLPALIVATAAGCTSRAVELRPQDPAPQPRHAMDADAAPQPHGDLACTGGRACAPSASDRLQVLPGSEFRLFRAQPRCVRAPCPPFLALDPVDDAMRPRIGWRYPGGGNAQLQFTADTPESVRRALQDVVADSRNLGVLALVRGAAWVDPADRTLLLRAESAEIVGGRTPPDAP